MKYVEELEQKVLGLIAKHQELCQNYANLAQECTALREQNRALEASLLKESTAYQELSTQSSTVMHTIEELLRTIATLETLGQ